MNDPLFDPSVERNALPAAPTSEVSGGAVRDSGMVVHVSRAQMLNGVAEAVTCADQTVRPKRLRAASPSWDDAARNDGLAYLSPGSEAVDLATGHGVRHGRKRRTNRGWAAKTAFEEHRALVGFEH